MSPLLNLETKKGLSWLPMTLPTSENNPRQPIPTNIDRTVETDAEVFRALKSGDLSALGVIYDRYGELVYRLALRILNNPQEAEDLTQEVFLTFYQRDSYNPKRGSMSGFLMTLTRSRAIDRIRAQRSKWKFFQRWSAKDSSLTSMTTKTPLEQVSQDELSDRVVQALQKLPAEQHKVLELSYYQGMSQSQIAQHLNIPLGTVKTRSRQALLKMQKILNDLVQ